MLWSQGAPEAVLARCTHALTAADGGAVVPLSDAGREKVLQWVETSGRRQALRCLGLASRNMPADHRQVGDGCCPRGQVVNVELLQLQT